MTSTIPNHVAIIGAGISGLCLAVALQRQSISCTVYDSRPPSYDNEGSSIVLAANGLRFLDSWGVYKRIQSKSYQFSEMPIVNFENQIVQVRKFGDVPTYGYKAMSIPRVSILQELCAVLQERGVSVIYEKKFSRVLSESESGVTFEFSDGSVEIASLLVGADGVHSRIRSYIYPSVKPIYTGILAIGGVVNRSALRLPSKTYPIPATVVGATGGFLLIPHAGGEEILFGSSCLYPELDREGYERLIADKDKLLELMRSKAEHGPDIIQSALENLDKESLFIWPHRSVPRLESWISPRRRVMVLGDAAHAIPPSYGQGANLDIEDAHTFVMVLSNVNDKISLLEALHFWNSWREKRVDMIREATARLSHGRLGVEERKKLGDMDDRCSDVLKDVHGETWIYKPALEEEILAWVKERTEAVDKKDKSEHYSGRINSLL